MATTRAKSNFKLMTVYVKSTKPKHSERARIKFSTPEYSCPTCDKKFITAIRLRRHCLSCPGEENGSSNTAVLLETDHVNSNLNNNDENPYKFDEDTSTKQKIVKKSNVCPCCGEDLKTAHKADFKCKDCKKIFKFKQSYENHLKTVHSIEPGSIKCSQCPARCANLEMLIAHRQTHYKKKNVSCKVCKQTFTRKYQLDRHVMNLGCDGRVVEKFTCVVCSSQFKRKDNLKIHLRRHLLEQRTFKCRFCDDSFAVKSLCIAHEKRHEDQMRPECDTCGKILKSKTSLRKHLLIHSGEKPYSCEVCQRRFRCKEVLNRHMKIHTGVKPYKCEICHKGFIQPMQLRNHMFQHTHDNGFNCNYCDQPFPNKQSQNLHERFVHEGAEKLACEVEGCTKEFMKKSDLKTHMRLHNTQPFIPCPECTKTFRNHNMLASHLRTHRIEQPRLCPLCRNRAFARGDLILRHIRIKHKENFQQMKEKARCVLFAREAMQDSKKRLKVNNSVAPQDEELLKIIDAMNDDRMKKGSPNDKASTSAELNSEQAFDSLIQEDEPPKMTEMELAQCITQLLEHLIAKKTLKLFGWPKKSVDDVLEDVIKKCGQKVADKKILTRADCLRENTKQLFLGIIDDENIKRMLSSKSIDEGIRHFLKLISELE